MPKSQDLAVKAVAMAAELVAWHFAAPHVHDFFTYVHGWRQHEDEHRCEFGDSAAGSAGVAWMHHDERYAGS